MIDFSKLRDEDLEPLTERQREVFVRRREGQPWRQVCAEMGIAQASVSALVKRALAQMAERRHIPRRKVG
jgi:DNA-directed RNA polymerase specialized sigma24 family protein